MTAPAPRVRLERMLPSPIEDVFAAWTDPQAMAQWLSPTGRAEVEADVRVGGRLRVVMVGDGRRIEHTGEYREVDPPRRLVFSWISPYTGGEPSLVTVRLTAESDTETHLVLVHEHLPADAVESHGGGWSGILDNLERYAGGVS